MLDDILGGSIIVIIIISLIILVLYIWSIVWSYKDAERLGKPGWLVALLVAIASWPISFLVWLVVRNYLSKSHHSETDSP